MNEDSGVLDALGALYDAAAVLRMRQRFYMADRGNEERGKAVGEAAKDLDRVLSDVARILETPHDPR